MNEIPLARRLEIENHVKTHFGLALELKELIADQIAVSRSAEMTVFLASDDKLYALVLAKSRLVLDDVNKMLSRAGIVPNCYFPPAGRSDYFYEIALSQFKRVYPGRPLLNERDLDFYKTLAPYNPALAQVRQIKNGRIKTFDADVKGSWRTCCKYYYSKIDII